MNIPKNLLFATVLASGAASAAVTPDLREQLKSAIELSPQQAKFPALENPEFRRRALIAIDAMEAGKMQTGFTMRRTMDDTPETYSEFSSTQIQNSAAKSLHAVLQRGVNALADEFTEAVRDTSGPEFHREAPLGGIVIMDKEGNKVEKFHAIVDFYIPQGESDFKKCLLVKAKWPDVGGDEADNFTYISCRDAANTAQWALFADFKDIEDSSLDYRLLMGDEYVEMKADNLKSYSVVMAGFCYPTEDVNQPCESLVLSSSTALDEGGLEITTMYAKASFSELKKGDQACSSVNATYSPQEALPNHGLAYISQIFSDAAPYLGKTKAKVVDVLTSKGALTNGALDNKCE